MHRTVNAPFGVIVEGPNDLLVPDFGSVGVPVLPEALSQLHLSDAHHAAPQVVAGVVPHPLDAVAVRDPNGVADHLLALLGRPLLAEDPPFDRFAVPETVAALKLVFEVGAE